MSTDTGARTAADATDATEDAVGRPVGGPARPPRVLGRRAVVTAVGAAGAAVALTACGTDDGREADGTNGSAEGSGSTGGSDTGGGTVLARTTEIPEGGGTVFKDQRVVVTQPTAGEFKAFSATCTHQGCLVSKVASGTITCACHNSTFDAATGARTGGPATAPLPEQKITVEGGSITLA
ncbi:Rieske (2Fe-2S) protein [uncultured Streptomyces sp.]|uniref:Rieske (2Fe-2S) protein n=1 Tax=uncultured Streptomyces sp. TaxID=174707 RepID=UPI00260B5B63|nr:Rieske (2Fe-2S) protein [uncultured Streptomyces sp.]